MVALTIFSPPIILHVPCSPPVCQATHSLDSGTVLRWEIMEDAKAFPLIFDGKDCLSRELGRIVLNCQVGSKLWLLCHNFSFQHSDLDEGSEGLMVYAEAQMLDLTAWPPRRRFLPCRVREQWRPRSLRLEPPMEEMMVLSFSWPSSSPWGSGCRLFKAFGLEKL